MNRHGKDADIGEWFRRVQQAAGLGCWELDLSSNRLTWSDGMYILYGLDPAAGIPGPDTWRSILCPPDPADQPGNVSMGERIGMALRGEVPYIDDFRIVRQDTGEIRYIHTVGEVVADSHGMPARLFGVVQDVTAHKARESEIRGEGYRDALTGLYNRRFFEEEIQRLDTPRQRPISVVVGDVTGLRMVNDIHGYDAGDRLLAEAADLLRTACRAEDIVARWGGDEFIACLPRTDAESAVRVLERITLMRVGHAGNESASHPYPVLSLGCATRSDGSEPLRQVIRDAEEDLDRRRRQDRRETCEAMIRSTAETLRHKGIEGPEHTGRIGKICRAMGTRLGMDGKQLDELGLLARLHDIGLITVDAAMLTRPGPLTADERIEIRRHPETGSRIVRASQSHAEIAGLILAHHERWDGTGYPHRLAGTDIPLQARIFAVADTFASMTEPRPYRETPGASAAREEIRSQAGFQFDPELAALFIDLFDTEDLKDERGL